MLKIICENELSLTACGVIRDFFSDGTLVLMYILFVNPWFREYYQYWLVFFHPVFL